MAITSKTYQLPLVIRYNLLLKKFADECAGAFVQFDIVSENVLGNCSYDEGGDQPILDSYVRKDEVKQSVIEGEKLPISSGAVFTALQGYIGRCRSC